MSDTPTIVPLPGGGMARLRDPEDITGRHELAYQTILQAFGLDRFQAIVNSAAVADAAQTGVTDEEAFMSAVAEARLSYRESELLARLNSAVVFKWIAEVKGKDQQGRPLKTPASADDALDLPRDVLLALSQAAGKREAEQQAKNATEGDGFGPASALDPASPSVASNA